jgi:rubrerythrin
VAALLTLISTGLFAADSDFGALGAKSKSSLTLEQMLSYAIQDEYLARSEYEAIIQTYGNVRPFSNIIRAEEQHIQWLLDLYAGHGLVPPSDLSRSRVAVPENLKAALETGVQAEIDNIAMYQSFLGDAAAAPLPTDVRELFERLMAASENHLRAFRTNLSRTT